MNSWSELNHSARFKDYQTVSQLGLKGGCKKFASSLNHDSDLLNDLVDGLSRRGGCRATPPGGINTQSRTGFCFWSGAEPMQAEHGLVDYLHTCLSTWPQLRSVEVPNRFLCITTVSDIIKRQVTEWKASFPRLNLWICLDSTFSGAEQVTDLIFYFFFVQNDQIFRRLSVDIPKSKGNASPFLSCACYIEEKWSGRFFSQLVVGRCGPDQVYSCLPIIVNIFIVQVFFQSMREVW